MIMRTDIQGEGPLLVLVGGGLTGWLSWIPHQERLAPSRRVARAQPLVVDLGLENRAVPADYSIDLESRALGAAVEAIAPDQPVDVVAWSFGGYAALEYALDHPGRIRTLALIEPPALWVLEAAGDPEYDRETERLRPLAERFRGDVTEDDLEVFVQFAGLCPPGKRPRDLPQWPLWVEHRRSLRGQFDAELDHHDDVGRLRAFDPPVLLVKGHGSAPWLHRITGVLAQNLPNARVLELEGGHAPHIVEMDRFLDELRRFHDEVDRAASADR
jgi:pimeloyl-ACP methyl ester carboxylesterase